MVALPTPLSRVKTTLPVVLRLAASILLATAKLPLVDKFPAVRFPVMLAYPAMLAPAEDTTTTFDTPPTDTVILPLGVGISTLLVPLKILSPAMLPVKLALPVTVKSPLMITSAALANSPSKVMESVAFRV